MAICYVYNGFFIPLCRFYHFCNVLQNGDAIFSVLFCNIWYFNYALNNVIRNADYIIDMGPGGGEDGGRVVACGTPVEIRSAKASITGRYL